MLLGAFLAGAMGNLFDRLVFGAVRDFIEVHYYDVYRYPTFNLANSYLVCGATVLVVASFFAKPEQPPAQSTNASQPQGQPGPA